MAPRPRSTPVMPAPVVDRPPAPAREEQPPSREGWTFLTNHAHVLACVAREPEARVRDIADRVGITERAVLRILRDLDAAGVVRRTRQGRRTRYAIDGRPPLRHPVEAHRRVADLLALLAVGD
jgi:DNA-binding transcriptional ArsR family regulator